MGTNTGMDMIFENGYGVGTFYASRETIAHKTYQKFNTLFILRIKLLCLKVHTLKVIVHFFLTMIKKGKPTLGASSHKSTPNYIRGQNSTKR